MRHGAAARAAIISQLALLIAGCTQAGNAPAVSTTSGATTLTAEQRAAGWRSLFDGTSTSAWRGYHSPTFPAGWSIVDGVLTKSGSVGDLLSKEQFGNFELALDWNLSTGGNAGIFYRGTEEYDHIYWSA
ncbi:MAG: DUF1080 domain-containing protein, partial [Gemmatimonadales bacterium]